MGFDFTIYWEKKGENNLWKENYHEWKKHELCYGRKSWELVHALQLPVDLEDDPDDPTVSKENWDSLINEIKPIADKLPDIADAYYHYYYDEYEVEEDVKKYKRLMNEYEAWYNKTFDEYPTLGYDFSIGYIEEFYNANDKVQECFNNPDLLVKASISY